MFSSRRDYIEAIFANENAAQKKARNSIIEDIDHIHISAVDGALLQFLIRTSNIKTIVEIGTLVGYSALWMADALPSGGHIYTLEHDPRRVEMAQKNFAGQDNITLIEGDAHETLPTLTERGPFDMIFIDADKLHYLDYLDWAEDNIRKGGLIIGDNTFLFDAVWKEGPVDRVRDSTRDVMRQFNKRLADLEKYHSILLPTEQGMTVALKLFG